MVGVETERNLAELLFGVADLERQVELARLSLCENRDFEPYSAFKRIDRLGTSFITPYDLRDFLDVNRVFVTEAEVRAIIRQYDSDEDGKLLYTDFHQLVLPATNLALRDLAITRPSYSTITSDVEYLLARLIERELNYQRNVEERRRFLTQRYDFSLLELFRLIDRPATSHLSRIKLMDFIRRNGLSVFDEDLDAILRRLDSDGDAQLSYSEFVEGVLPVEPTYRPSSIPSYVPLSPSRRSPSPRHASPLRRSGSPSRGSPSRGSPGRYTSSFLAPETSYLASSSPRSPARSPVRSPARSSLRSPARSPIRSSNLTVSEENEIATTFKQQINLSRDLENAKNDLALRADFNLSDAYNIFDLENKGFITTLDFEDALLEFGVRQVRDEIQLLFRHYGSLSETRLRFSEFCDMFTPKRTDYGSMLRNRGGSVYPPMDRRRVFNAITSDRFIECIRLFLEVEGMAEALRQRMSRRASFSLYDAFLAVDRDRNGYITIDEFQDILRTNGIYADIKDLESLMELYDRNKDGRVSYSEFVQEVTPKSPRRY